MFGKAIDKLYPGMLVKANGAPFVRPAWTGDTTTYISGWYWENADGDRFYFADKEDCAMDCAMSMGMDAHEAQSILNRGGE